jgi:prephenate dehydratase
MHVDLHQAVYDAAYQGAPGAYSEEAAHALLGPTATTLPRRSLEQVFEAVSAGGARYGVVPVENTLSGTVPNVYELLLSHDLRVVGETLTHIDHVLVGPPDVRREDVRRVLSHPVALAQCAEFFRKNRNIQAVPVFDTAGAVEIVIREDDGFTAAIAARRAATLYKANVLAEHLQDHPENWTRFLLLTRPDDEKADVSADALAKAGANKALVAFDLPHQPGSLAHALLALADREVNLTKIESRPIAGKPFEYRFVIELTIDDGSAKLRSAIDHMKTVTPWLRVLGAYKVGPTRT